MSDDILKKLEDLEDALKAPKSNDLGVGLEVTDMSADLLALLWGDDWLPSVEGMESPQAAMSRVLKSLRTDDGQGTVVLLSQKAPADTQDFSAYLQNFANFLNGIHGDFPVETKILGCLQACARLQLATGEWLVFSMPHVPIDELQAVVQKALVADCIDIGIYP